MAQKYDIQSGQSNEPAARSTDTDTLSTYDVGQLQYPSDLTSEEGRIRYGGNKVMFFINIQGGGKLAAETPEASIPLKGNRYMSGETTDTKPILGGAVAGALNKANETLKSDSVAATSNKILTATQPNKRLKEAICLYMPEALTKSYGVEWGMEDGEQFINGLVGEQALLAMSNNPNNSRSDGSPVTAAATGIASKMLNGMKYTQKALGISPGNAKAQLLFKQVDFGEFSFDYRFAPRDETEAENVLRIIRTFRHHMLPEYFDKLNYLYIYPSEFEIRYYNGNAENPYLEHHITSVLTNLTVNYNPNGQYTTFANGMPTHINLTLRFKELGVPTKETSPTDVSGA